MSIVYLICGNTAAGKTTYSMELAKQCDAVRFSIDPWMQTLYGADYNPQIHDFSWLIERTERCKTQIRQMCEGLIGQGVNVILDFGFGDVASRRYYREWAAAQGAHVSLHFLDTPAKERRMRIHKRNDEKGASFAFKVTDEMFDYVEAMFVPPSPEELADGLRVAL